MTDTVLFPYVCVSPHYLGPVPVNLHADVAGAVSLRRDVELAELGLFGGGEETGVEGSHTPPPFELSSPGGGEQTCSTFTS